MKLLEGLSFNSKISLGVALVIMMTFFVVQTCIVFGLCEPSLFLAKFGWGCVVFFMPPFFKVVVEFINNIRLKEANIDLQLKAIDKSNLVVMMDMDGYILEANDKFCTTMGCKEKDRTCSNIPMSKINRKGDNSSLLKLRIMIYHFRKIPLMLV